MRLTKACTLLWGAAIGAMIGGAMPLHAAELGKPVDWQLGLQASATPVMDNVTVFHDNIMMPLITGTVVLVLILLIWVMIRFNAKSNPVPSKTTHNTLIEVLWTVVPVLILVIIAIPSFRLLYFERTIPDSDLTIKATGSQWYWSYEYPDNGELSFDALLLDGQALEDRRKIVPNSPRLLATDNPIVVPLDKNVRMIVTAADVLHSWTIPSFGTKIDAIPGRLNEIWFKVEREGVYYGQCSELCGQGHAYMPIELWAVSQDRYDAWLKQANDGDLQGANEKLFADGVNGSAPKVAAASAE